MTPHVTAAVPKLKNVFARCQRWPGLCLCFAALSWKAPALPDHFPLSVGADVSCLPTSCFSTPWAFPEDPTCSVKFPAQHTCCSTSSLGGTRVTDPMPEDSEEGHSASGPLGMLYSDRRAAAKTRACSFLLWSLSCKGLVFGTPERKTQRMEQNQAESQCHQVVSLALNCSSSDFL